MSSAADTKQITVQEWNVGGVPLLAVGAKNELFTTGIFFLHGRLESKSTHLEFAKQMQAKLSTSTNNIMIFLIDHRNHGDRIVNKEANEGWKTNPNHATDMWAMIYGTAFDLNFLIQVLPLWVGSPIKQWIACGFSLGGHAVLMAMAHVDEIKIGVSIAGCGDYKKMMLNRASRMNIPVPPCDDTFISDQLLALIAINDPVNCIDSFKGKKILVIHGTEDRIVPIMDNNEFISNLAEKNDDTVELYKELGGGHVLSDQMKEKSISWIELNL